MLAICVPFMTMFTTETHVAKLPIYNFEFYLYIGAIFLLWELHLVLGNAAWQYNTVGTTAVLVFMSIPLTYCIDWLIIGREISSVELIGVALIFVTNIAIVTLRLLKFIN